METIKTKILIIDDDEFTRTMYVEVFRREGFDVEEAVDGADGLDKAIAHTPHVIFTGIIMPRMDGFSLMEALKKNVATSNIPVAISSHMGRREDQAKSQSLGAKDFISRDMTTPNQVVERIRAILNLDSYKIKFSSAELDAQTLASEMHFDPKFRCKGCGEDLVLSLIARDLKSREFSARFVCAKCGQFQS